MLFLVFPQMSSPYSVQIVSDLQFSLKLRGRFPVELAKRTSPKKCPFRSSALRLARVVVAQGVPQPVARNDEGMALLCTRLTFWPLEGVGFSGARVCECVCVCCVRV